MGPRAAPFDGSGLFHVPVPHVGNQNVSTEEADAVERVVATLTRDGASWTDAEGERHPLTLEDILIVAPYNAHVAELSQRPPGMRVGTVDKFQG